MAAEHSPSIIFVQSCQTILEAKKPSDGQHRDKKDKLQEVSYWNSLYFFGILAALCLNAAILFLIPRHNSILYPEFWYEILCYIVIGVSTRHSASHILELYIFTNQQDLLRKSHYLKVFLTCSLSFAVPYCTSYLVWTILLENNHPLPSLGSFTVLGGLSINIVSFWFFFSPDLRKQETIRRQAKAFLIFRLWAFLHTFARGVLSTIAKSSVQWLLIMLIPLFRNFGIWVAERMVNKFPEANNEDVKFLLRSEMMINYTTYLTGRVTTLNPTTIYGIFIVELALHVIACYEIVKNSNKIDVDAQSTANAKIIKDRKENIQTLVMSEFTEAVVPVAFAIVFSMVFFGPNAILMNGVGNNYFGGNVIKDSQVFYLGMLQIFAFDVLVMIMSVISLKCLCDVNLFHEFCNIMKKYWIVFLIKLPSITFYYVTNDVNLGMDESTKFLWITDEGRHQMICYAEEHLDEENSRLLPNLTLCEE